MNITLQVTDHKTGIIHSCLAIVLSLVVCGFLWGAEGAPKSHFNSLKTRLVKDGFKRKVIEKIFNDPAVTFELKAVSSYFVHSEARLNYDQFSTPSMIEKARAYMAEHKQELNRAKNKFDVAPEVITAIILVETKLGAYVGRNPVLAILSTIAVMTDTAPREMVWKALPEDRRYARTKFDQKADTKASWAYQELKAFLTYSKQQKIDPVSVTGSYAGAVGLAQFMPSNILAYGEDGNADGKINLFEHADAISSIARYLKHFGWRPDLSSKEAGKVIYHYNHSDYYVNTILKIADLLKQP